MTNLINHLKQLDKDATPPGEWGTTGQFLFARTPDPNSRMVTVGSVNTNERSWKHSLELIVSLRNALPQIISLLEAGEKLRILASLLTVRQVIEAGDKYIDAAGLHPWAINEGLASGDEHLSFDSYDYHFDTIKKELE